MAESNPEPAHVAADARLRAVRETGQLALSTLERARRGLLKEGEIDRRLASIQRLNTDAIRDPELGRLLAESGYTTHRKLVSVLARATDMAAKIESPLLPAGWTVRESLHERHYEYAGGAATITVTKGEPDPERLEIKVYGYTTWSGYEGGRPGHMALSVSMRRAQETLADPSSHLSVPAVMKLSEAKEHWANGLQHGAWDVLEKIRAFDDDLNRREGAPTGDDYNSIVELALGALTKWERLDLLIGTTVTSGDARRGLFPERSDDRITFRVWHDGDGSVALPGDQATVELSVRGLDSVQRKSYIEQASHSLREMFSDLWDARAKVITDQDLVAAEAELTAAISGRSEALNVLRKEGEAWQATADRYQHMLLGERMIVLDTLERAFTQLNDGGEPRIKLELPKPDLTGISLMDSENALLAKARLEAKWPEFAPFTVRDFQEYAQSRANHARELFVQIAAHVDGRDGIRHPRDPVPAARSNSSPVLEMTGPTAEVVEGLESDQLAHAIVSRQRPVQGGGEPAESDDPQP